jgi:hypothetical protein
VTLTDAATIDVDASLGSEFDITLSDDRTLSNVTGATDRQRLTFNITQGTGGSHLLIWDTNYLFGADVTEPTLSTTEGKTDVVTGVYHSDTGKVRILAVSKGY